MRRQGERCRQEQLVVIPDNYLMNAQLTRKNIYAVMAGSIRILRELYHVESLSIIEGVRLRQIVVMCVDRYREEVRMLLSGEWTHEEFVQNHSAPAQNAADEWLLDCYGMNPHAVAQFNADQRQMFALQREQAHAI